ncbi:MAG: RNA polymerase factor sigma-54 [Candidatus Omnitrophota bacterium]
MLQKMALTPQMKQSIQLLGMSTKDLNEYVDAALEKNPFLKKEITAPRTAKASDDDYDYTANIRQEENPRMNFISQLEIMDIETGLLDIAKYLIYEMDDNGYINIDLEDAAQELAADTTDIEAALAIVQSMEPAGIGARNIQECLSLQLKRRGKEDSVEYRIVNGFLNELTRNDAEKIAKQLKISSQQAETAIKTIKLLNPRPTSTLFSKEAHAVTPDLIAEVGGKKLRLWLNRQWLPNITFYNPYEDEPEITEDATAKKFITENKQAAKGLIDGLKRREETLLKVAQYLLGFQLDSFIDESRHIKSLAIKDVASALKMHTTTISRTVSHKYVQINNQTMPLKGLLSGEIKNKDGQVTSKASIKTKINALVKAEDKTHPLSDKQIKESLEKEGISINRRTVAKYRDSLRLLPAHLRRKS